MAGFSIVYPSNRLLPRPSGPITGLRLLVLPRVFPTERSLAALHPLGPTLRKHPLTDFTAYAVAVPAPHLRARSDPSPPLSHPGLDK